MTERPTPPTAPSTRWSLLLISLALASRGIDSFQTIHRPSCRSPMSPSSASSIATRVKMASSFQQARLAEQLRLSTRQSQSEGTDGTDVESQDESSVLPPAAGSSDDMEASEEVLDILALEDEALGPDGMPFAPMMTYQKYLTMQEKRIKVTIRYSAEAGLRPFYLTVANQIKSTHPDVLLEKRILPPVGSDAGGGEAVFEIVVDGKTLIGKKKTKLLKVSSARTSGSDDDKVEDTGKGDDLKSGGGDTNTPDIAGGRSIFVSMDKLDQELIKARRRRRPNTMYKNKEDALRGAMATTEAAGVGSGTVAEGGQHASGGNNSVQSTSMTEAVMRLERLKAMSTRSKI